MKKMICTILAGVLMCMSFAYAEEEPKAAAGTGLGFELLENLYDGENNLVISPVSLSFALAMAAQGAEGETRSELLTALGAEDLSEMTALMEALAGKGLKQANAAFVSGDMAAKEDYISALEEMFGAEWFENDGDPAAKINGWVQEHTDGLIEKLVEELPQETMLVLANAIAMDAKWMAEFDPNATFDDVFHAPDGDVTAAFMHRTFYADYGEREDVQLLRLHYRTDDYDPTGMSMMIALPAEGSVETVLEGLKAEGLGYFTFGEDQRKVRLSMPKTDISAQVSLGDALKALGVKTAFSDNADLSGITEDMPLRIGSVLQKARLMMDEEGTKAAAATAVMVEAMGMIRPEEIAEFNMNRPFVLVIADEETGAVCFAAAVMNPISN